MEIFEKIKGILTEPSNTFDKLKEETLNESLKYFAIIIAIYSVSLKTANFIVFYCV